MLSSQLFAGDPLLEAIAADGPQRISTFQNQNDPAVAKVQQALLLWRPDVLPVHGTDGHYGSETAAAVTSFKIDELAVPPEQVIADVGPQTVRRLDEIALAAEQPPIPPEPTTFVRQDVYQLQPPGAPVHPIIAAYAVAVRELKRNNGPQHRLWSHHTQVHGMNPDPGDGLRNQCQHFCWYFLPWHRMYLHAFEAICRSIIVESAEVDDETKATWALPYWDYDRADSAELPPAFRDPVLKVPRIRFSSRHAIWASTPPSSSAGNPRRGSRGSSRSRPAPAAGSPTARSRTRSSRPSRAPRRDSTVRAHPMPSGAAGDQPARLGSCLRRWPVRQDERLRSGGRGPHLLVAPRQSGPALGGLARRRRPGP